nr:glycosyltransferase family 4 protein [Rhodanobacter sp. DHG33]
MGGPQIRIMRVAAALIGRVDTLVVMSRDNSGAFYEKCVALGIPCRVIALTRITREWRVAIAYVALFPSEVIKLARLFRCERIDLVHASGGSWQIKAVIASQLAGIPCVWHLNDTLMPGWIRWLFRAVQPLAAGFIYTGQRVKEYYGRYVTNNRPSAIVQPPVDIHEYDPESPPCVDEEPADLFGDGFVIGTIGNVNPVKGIETIIRAAALLNNSGRFVRVVVIGPVFQRQRHYADHLKVLADQVGLNDICFLGGRADVRPILKRVDVYVCASLSESWGMSLWEAMAMAKPVVSTDVGDVARYVVDGESGFVVPVEDSEAMAERIGRLIDSPELRQRIGHAARNLAAEFSPENIADKTLEIYDRVLASSRCRGLRP